jgi:hypothetical protein
MIDAMKQGLKVLDPDFHNAMTTLRQAIEQAEKQEKLCKYCGGIGRVVCNGRCMPEQEPVANRSDCGHKEFMPLCQRCQAIGTQAHSYTAPNMSTKPENIDTSEERVHETDKSVHEEIERLKAEIKRLQDLAEYRLKLLMQMPENKPWVGLTDEEIKGILDCGRGGLVDIKKAEQILKERNNG